MYKIQAKIKKTKKIIEFCRYFLLKTKIFKEEIKEITNNNINIFISKKYVTRAINVRTKVTIIPDKSL